MDFSHWSAWHWLAVSAAALGLGPAVLALARQWPLLLGFVDGFVLASVGGVVAADVLPDALRHGGVTALALVFAGLLGPGFLEARLHKAAAAVHAAAMAAGVAGLALHAGLDGAALAGARAGGDLGLPTAVLLHRLPEGLTIWWLVAPAYGRWAGAGVLAAVAAATAAGLGLAESAAGWADAGALAWLQALVAGSLLHVVVHRTEHVTSAGAPVRAGNAAAGVGALAGLGVLAAVLQHHAPGDGHAADAETFWDLARESAPPLLLAYAAAGLVQALLPAGSVRWLAQGSRLGQAVRGALFGLPLPVCSCGVVPVYRSLVLQGVPAAAGLAFLIATPELGLDAVLLSVPLLGVPMAIARVVAAAAVAVTAGWLLAWLTDSGWTGPALRHELAAHGATGAATAPLWQRVRAGLASGFGEMVDHTGPWVLVGLAVAALGQPLFAHTSAERLPAALAVPLWALLGVPMYVCASGATPLVAVLLAAGGSPGAGLAFLLTGPATNLSTFGVLAQLHGRRLAAAFMATMAALAVLAGYVVHAILAGYRPPPLHDTAHSHGGGLADWALACMALLLLASVLRQGPRGFVGQIIAVARPSWPPMPAGSAQPAAPPQPHDHHHHHGHHHDQHHGHHHH